MDLNIKNIAINLLVSWIERQDTIDETRAENYIASFFAGLNQINLELENLQLKPCENQEADVKLMTSKGAKNLCHFQFVVNADATINEQLKEFKEKTLYIEKLLFPCSNANQPLDI